MHAHTTLSIHVQYLLLLCVHESLLPSKEKFLDGTLQGAILVAVFFR